MSSTRTSIKERATIRNYGAQRLQKSGSSFSRPFRKATRCPGLRTEQRRQRRRRDATSHEVFLAHFAPPKALIDQPIPMHWLHANSYTNIKRPYSVSSLMQSQPFAQPHRRQDPNIAISRPVKYCPRVTQLGSLALISPKREEIIRLNAA